MHDSTFCKRTGLGRTFLPICLLISLATSPVPLGHAFLQSHPRTIPRVELFPVISRAVPKYRVAIQSHNDNKDNDNALLDAIYQMKDAAPHMDAKRIFHGKGGYYPGMEHLTLDWFDPVFLLTSHNQDLGDDEVQTYRQALQETFHPENEEVSLVYQCRNVNTPTVTRIISGPSPPNPHIVTEQNGTLQYIVDITRNQNHGLFLDMANGREFVLNDAQEKNVLNLFAYTCGFSVAALIGGARQVVNMDMSHGALKVGQRNHDCNGIGRTHDNRGKARFLAHDIFKSWGKLKKLGPYDLIIMDPPSYQTGSFVAKKDYIKLIRRIPSLITPNGKAMLCLNAPELNSKFLIDLVVDTIPGELEFVRQIENPASFAALDSERSLKVLLFQKRHNQPNIIDE